jgi:hypothetical protein
LLAAAVSIGSAIAAPAQAQSSCSGGSILNGWYGGLITGNTLKGVAKFIDGTFNFNGACAFTGTVDIGENATTGNFTSISGTYGANADGTLSLSFTLPGETSPETYNVGVSPLFNEALGIETDPSAVATIDLKAQNYPATGSHEVYNNASLKGTFTAACSGSTAYSDLNYFTFDGTTNASGIGGITGADRFNNSAQFGDLPYTGTYVVASDGYFGGSVLVGGSSAFGFSGVIDNDLNEIQFVYNTGTTPQDIVSCVGKRVAPVTAPPPAGFACHVAYAVTSQWPLGFNAGITIYNTGTTAISSWKLTWSFANGQSVLSLWNGAASQSGANVTVNNLSYNGSIPAGGSYNGVGFTGFWNNQTNAVPTSFAVNGTQCN